MEVPDTSADAHGPPLIGHQPLPPGCHSFQPGAFDAEEITNGSTLSVIWVSMHAVSCHSLGFVGFSHQVWSVMPQGSMEAYLRFLVC